MSAFPWTEHLPGGWSCLPLRHVTRVQNSNVDKKSYDDGIPVRLCNYTDVYYNEYIGEDLEFMQATATPSEIARLELRSGDVIITKDSESWDDIAVPACVSRDMPGVVCGYHLTLLRPLENIAEGRFLLRALQADGVRDQFWVASNGITRFGLGQQGMKDALIPIPPLLVQRAIADFLDQKTAAIDALIEKKERLLELLAEKRLALIHQVVTKGIDPSVPIRDSGVPWIGEIPAHWEVIRLKFLLQGIEQGWSPQCEQRLAEGDEWGVLKVGCVNYGGFRASEHKALPADASPRERFQVRLGDLLMSRANTAELVGSVALVTGELPARLLLCDKLYRLRLRRGANPIYMSILLNDSSVRHQHEAGASGTSASMQNISQDRVGNLILCLPPDEEQDEIVRSLHDELATLDSLEKALRKQLGGIREYRQSLITAAVTGQLDIPAITDADDLVADIPLLAADASP